MTIYRLGDRMPQIDASCFVADEATIIGDVVVHKDANIWFGSVMRGDNERITIGEATSIQDGVVMHTDPGFPLDVGRGVTVGHQATLHGCEVCDGALIGMQAVVLNGAVVGAQCLVGAGALVTEGSVFPERQLILGVPAKAVRELTDDEVANLENIADRYVQRGLKYRETLVPVDREAIDG